MNSSRHATNLILSGGGAHPYEKTTPILCSTLEGMGVSTDVAEDFNFALESERLFGYNTITLNCFKFTVTHTDDPKAREWLTPAKLELSPKAMENFHRFLVNGGGLHALHAATLCFDDWDAFPAVIGAKWVWERSGHHDLGPKQIHVTGAKHPITKGLEDFEILDEVYGELEFSEQVTPLLDAVWKNKRQPLLWAKNYHEARILYNALGHDERAFENPVMQELIQRGHRWVEGNL